MTYLKERIESYNKNEGSAPVALVLGSVLGSYHTNPCILYKNYVIFPINHPDIESYSRFIEESFPDKQIIRDPGRNRQGSFIQADKKSCSTLGLVIGKTLLKNKNELLDEMILKFQDDGCPKVTLPPECMKYSQSSRYVRRFYQEDIELRDRGQRSPRTLYSYMEQYVEDGLEGNIYNTKLMSKGEQIIGGCKREKRKEVIAGHTKGIVGGEDKTHLEIQQTRRQESEKSKCPLL